MADLDLNLIWLQSFHSMMFFDVHALAKNNSPGNKMIRRREITFNILNTYSLSPKTLRKITWKIVWRSCKALKNLCSPKIKIPKSRKNLQEIVQLRRQFSSVNFFFYKVRWKSISAPNFCCSDKSKTINVSKCFSMNWHWTFVPINAYKKISRKDCQNKLWLLTFFKETRHEIDMSERNKKNNTSCVCL